jgi:glycosyltransferase involved in cell wall biosynthesis
MESTDSNSMPHPAPMVSVAVASYNLEKHLPKALDSILIQKTNFPIEVVIGDDGSQDTSVQVARSYQEKHPGLIRILEHEKNAGVQRNFFDIFHACQGKYIAWLDADDYWTDPEKLAIQVAALEADPSISACCHFVRWVSPDGAIKREKLPSVPAGRYGMEEILRRNFVQSVSVMFRNGVQNGLPQWYFEFASMSDWPIHVLSAKTGDILLIDRIMADYVLMPNSSFMAKGRIFQDQMDAKFYEHIESVLPAAFHRLVHAQKGKRYESVAYLLRKKGDFVASREAAVKAFLSPSPMDNLGSKTKALLAAVVREAEWRLKGSPAASQE